jgi:hypothetical protein
MTITFAKSNYGNGLKQNRICRNIKINVEVPKKLTDKQMKIIEQLAAEGI